MVSIAAFQAVDLGSIPGQRTLFFSFVNLFVNLFVTFFCMGLRSLDCHECLYLSGNYS